MTGHLARQAGPPAEAGMEMKRTASTTREPRRSRYRTEPRPSSRECAPLPPGVNLVRPRLRLRALQIDPDSSMARGRTQEGRGSMGDRATPICVLRSQTHLTRPRSFRDDRCLLSAYEPVPGTMGAGSDRMELGGNDVGVPVEGVLFDWRGTPDRSQHARWDHSNRCTAKRCTAKRCTQRSPDSGRSHSNLGILFDTWASQVVGIPQSKIEEAIGGSLDGQWETR